MLDQNNYALQWNSWLWKWGESNQCRTWFLVNLLTLSSTAFSTASWRNIVWPNRLSGELKTVWIAGLQGQELVTHCPPGTQQQAKYCRGTTVCTMQYLHQRPGQWHRVHSIRVHTRVSIFSVGVKLAEWLTPQNAEFQSSRTFKLKEWPTEVSQCFSGKHRALQKWWNNLKHQYKLRCEELCGSLAKVYFL